MEKRYLFFDLDGTLTNPEEGITRSFQYALEAFGIPVEDRRALRAYIGPPLSASFAKYFAPDMVSVAIKKYRERYGVLGWKENALYPGMDEALRRLQESGKHLVMATSKAEPYAVQIAEHFGIAGYFDALCGSDPGGGRETKEEVLRYAMEKTGAHPEESLMIGDRCYDVEGAAACGIETLGVLYGFGSKEELETAGAIQVVSTVEELCETCLLL